MTFLTTCGIAHILLQIGLRASTTAFYSQHSIYGKKLKNEPEMPYSASSETFFEKPLDKRSEVCYAYAPEAERAAGQAPDVLDIPTSVPRVRGGR